MVRGAHPSALLRASSSENRGRRGSLSRDSTSNKKLKVGQAPVLLARVQITPYNHHRSALFLLALVA
jgi:hypothetical protein